MALISLASLPFRVPGRRARVAFAVCVALCGCDMQRDDNAAAPGDAADAASAAEAPEPASGWRFVRIGASAADAAASMSARVKDDRRLSRDRDASVADAPSSAASPSPPEAASTSTARRP
ncbi:TPA: cytochrome c, partial [Burkholderia cenocepacia]